jgi:hypothetical protein
MSYIFNILLLFVCVPDTMVIIFDATNPDYDLIRTRYQSQGDGGALTVYYYHYSIRSMISRLTSPDTVPSTHQFHYRKSTTTKQQHQAQQP